MQSHTTTYWGDPLKTRKDLSFKDNFEKEKYDEVIRCDNCGAEVRQLKGGDRLDIYDSEGKFINSGHGELPKRS